MVMTSDVGQRARERAQQARERAREAGQRAAELATDNPRHDAEALLRSRAAVERATQLAKEGYRHAAEAELAAAQAHDTFAEALHQRAARGSGNTVALVNEAARHRGEAEEHRRRAAEDQAALRTLEGQEGSAPLDG